MYVDFMKNFLLGDSSKLLAVRLILASWDQKRLILLSTPDVRWVHEQFSSRRFEPAHGFQTHFGHLCPRMFDSNFLDMIHVDIMKNFLLADSSELLTVRLILAS